MPRAWSVVVIAALLVAACGADRPATVVFGDSLVGQLTDEELPAEFGPAVEVHAEFGAPMERWLDTAAEVGAAGDVDAAIIALGTNDVGGGIDQQDLAEVDQLLDSLAPIGCLRWPTVTTVGDRPTWPEDAAAFNDYLVAKAEERPALVLIPWAQTLTEHPEYLESDGVHHTPEGQRAFAAALSRSVADC